MDPLFKDFRYGFRMLLKDPGFAAAAVITLALTIGANTAIFSVVNAVLLRALPFKEPSRLMLVTEAIPAAGFPVMPFSAPDLKVYEREQRSFEKLGVFQNKEFEISGDGAPARVVGSRISPTLFPVLGVQPAVGRNFEQGEDLPGEGSVILSHGLWKGRFGGDPSIIGKTMRIDRHPATIVGVMPAGFDFPMRGLPRIGEAAVLWVPIGFTQVELQAQGSMYNNLVVGRLARGVTREQAAAEAAALARRIEEGYPPELKQALAGAELGMLATPLQRAITGEVRAPLLILLGAVGLVLLIGCANVANLLLARAAARRREMAVRGALGASPARLVQQVLAEGLLLALIGGAAGVMLAWWTMGLFVAVIPSSVPRSHEIGIQPAVLLYSLLLSVATAIIFGLAPSLGAARVDLREAIQEGGRTGGASRGRRRLQAAFVVAQVALALVLLCGSGLLIRSFTALLSTDPGFKPQRVLTFSTSLPLSDYPEAARIKGFYLQAIERLSAVPGVRAVSAGTALPLEVREARALEIEGVAQGSGQTPPAVAHVWVAGDYFGGLQIRLLRGRLFTPADREGQEQVAIISDSMARIFWPGQDPVGRRMRWSEGLPWMTVVGVVADVKDGPLQDSPMPHSYSPYVQEADDSYTDPVVDQFRGLRFAIAAERDPLSMTNEVRQVIGGLDSQLAIAEVRTMEDRLDEVVAPLRFSMWLLAVFAAVAVVLASVGVYGVTAYSVAQRTHEIGVRMALGARRSNVLRLVLGQTGTLVALGLGIGLAGSLAAARLLTSLLFGVKPTDPTTYVLAVIVLGCVGLIASLVPAHRATCVDPVIALRYE